MLSEDQIRAMIELLDDSDEEVVQSVEKEFLAQGPDIIPMLDEIWHDKIDLDIYEKVQRIIKKINFETIAVELENWAAKNSHDLLEGIIILSKVDKAHPDITYVRNQIHKIKLDAWLEMNYDLTALEKVRVLNHIFYEVNGFAGDNETYTSPANSFIHSVLKRRKGNPVSLAIIYSIIAQKLNIPIFGVNLPQHFILAYMSSEDEHTIASYDEKPSLDPQNYDDVLFYINPFNKGMVFARSSIDMFLKQMQLEPQDTYFIPCSNIDIIKRVLRNIISSYKSEQREDRRQEAEELLRRLEGRDLED